MKKQTNQAIDRMKMLRSKAGAYVEGIEWGKWARRFPLLDDSAM